MPAARPHTPLWVTLTPVLFVFCWASGFPVTSFGIEYAEPLTLLAIRSALNVIVVGAALPFLAAAWPATWREAGHIAVAGFLLHSAYLSCIFIALGEGVPQGTVALIAGMQPLVTAVLVGRALGERIGAIQWVGFALGFAGLACVLGESVSVSSGTPLGYIAAAFTPILITAASLYQKRYCAAMDLRTGMIIQHGTAFFTTGALALLVETNRVAPSLELALVLVWLVLVLSVAASNLYYILLRRGEAARVSSLFYLTPPTTVLLGYLSFGESFGPAALAGFAIAGLGVFLVTRRGGAGA